MVLNNEEFWLKIQREVMNKSISKTSQINFKNKNLKIIEINLKEKKIHKENNYLCDS